MEGERERKGGREGFEPGKVLCPVTKLTFPTKKLPDFYNNQSLHIAL